jgi:hypothetical protein
MDNESGAQPRNAGRRRRCRLILMVLFVLGGAWLAVRFTSDQPVDYASPEEHFRYGSTGGERASGIPLSVWLALPKLFPDLLPGPGLESLGFIYEPGRELPIGVSRRRVQGVDRVFLNCAACHVGSYRTAPGAPRVVVTGMPANTLDLQAFQRFLSACAVDERFTGGRIVPLIAHMGTDDFLNRWLLRLVGVDLMREKLLMLRQRFSFMDREPVFGPGRVDTFNPPKVLLNFRMDRLPESERIGVSDFPSVWQQRRREGMQLHWDGNNTSVDERNRSAAFGTGAQPPTLDRPALRRMADYLLDAEPPSYPLPIDSALASRGRLVYEEYCAGCHGRNGRDFSGALVGKVTPIGEIGTDRGRLDSYTHDLAANQNLLYAAYPAERFSHFRKTDGYANQPLDGLWLRGPYLHNGSVPSIRALLSPARERPAVFYRGYDVLDARNLGFVSDVASEGGRSFFLFDTSLRGNGNQGHEGPAFGTELPLHERDALIEYLKTF